MQRLLRGLMLSASVFALATSAEAAGRVALVIGNGAYQSQSKLPNPTNDAEDIAAMLKRLGFVVVEGHDLDYDSLRRKRIEFNERLREATAEAEANPGGPQPIALFYYSGHGIQVDGKNYVVPTDARLERPGDEKNYALDLDVILRDMNQPGRTSIIILDACRDNPFTKQMTRSVSGRTRAAESSDSGGLAPVTSSRGSIIIYATAPDTVAQDGDGRNSPFTAAFLAHAPTPGVDLRMLMPRVGADVLHATQSRQIPWMSQALDTPSVILAGEATVQQAALTTGAPQIGQSPSRHIVPNPLPPGPGQRTPQTPRAPVKSEAELAGEACDNSATDREDPMRSPTTTPVPYTDPAISIPACEEAVKLNPKVLRYQNQLGRAYYDGERYEDALRVARRAADRGAAYSVNTIGVLTFRGWGGAKKDYVQARLWYEKGAALGSSNAMKQLGFMHLRGIGGPVSTEKGIELMNRAIASGNRSATAWLGDFYIHGVNGVTKDIPKGRAMFERGAAEESPEAMSAMGFLAQRGIGQKTDFEAARKWYEKAAAYGSSDGMFNLGYLYYAGDGGMPKDYKLAWQWLSRAAKLKNGSAYYLMGHMQLAGQGVEASTEKALELFNKAIDHEDWNAMKAMAEAYMLGTLGPVDRERARALLRQAAELGDEDAQAKLASFDKPETPGEACDRLAGDSDNPDRNPDIKPAEFPDFRRGIPFCYDALKADNPPARYRVQLARGLIEEKKYAEALEQFKMAAAAGSSFAALWVGNYYVRDYGLPRSNRMAVEWFEKAAVSNQRNALFNLGIEYVRGSPTVPQDYAKARAYFIRASQAGEIAAETELGHLYYAARGVPRDYRRARAHYETAAAGNNRIAMYMLGRMYRSGEGVAINHAVARQWYAQAAALNELDAMRGLAELYLAGQGGEIETDKARGLLEQGAGEGDDKAMALLAQAHLAGAFGTPNENAARDWYDKAAAKGNAIAKRWLAATPDDGRQGGLCDKLAGDDDDPLRSIEHPPTRRVDAEPAIAACEAAVKADPDILRYQNQLGRAYIEARRYFDAMRVLRKAAEEDSAFAAFSIGNIYSRGWGFPKNDAQALLWYQKAAEAGSKIGMHNLGIEYINRYLDGIEPDKNGPLALQWFEKAAGLGLPNSMVEISRMYHSGHMVSKSPEKRIEWLKKAAEFKSGEALWLLSDIYFSGTGVPADKTLARQYAQKASDVGNLIGRRWLAYMTLMGEGGTKDVAEGRRLYEQNIAAGHALSMVDYARAHLSGMFGPVDRPYVRQLLERAADLGDADAKRRLEVLEKEEREAARKAAAPAAPPAGQKK